MKAMTDGTQRIFKGEYQFKLWCPDCKRYLSYNKFPTAINTDSGRQATCTNCQKGIKPEVIVNRCPTCGRS